MGDVTFPRLAYKVGGPWALECGSFSVKEVPDAETFAAMQAEGWYLTQEAASESTTDEGNDHGQEQEGQGRQGQEGLLIELREKAASLGIAFRPQWREKKLAEAIAEAEAAKA